LAATPPPPTPSGGTNVNTVTVTNTGTIPQSNSVTFGTAGTYYWAAFYFGDANNKPAVSGCATEPLTVNALTAQITPTNTTCQQFTSGTAPNLVGGVTYQTKGGSKIFNTQPGVFFYYINVTAPASSFTVDILQTIQTTGATGPLFGIMSTMAYDSGCNTLKSTNAKVSGSAADDVIMFSGATAGKMYVIAVKYSPKSIVGQPKPSPANITYLFEAKVTPPGTVVTTSPQTLNLTKTG
jgi:hypothetical protein